MLKKHTNLIMYCLENKPMGSFSILLLQTQEGDFFSRWASVFSRLSPLGLFSRFYGMLREVYVLHDVFTSSTYFSYHDVI